MQHTGSVAPKIPTGSRQIPLLSASQLVPGVLLTGPTYRSVRRVVEIDGDVVVLEKYPRPIMPLTHLHGFTLMGNKECACGLRREPMAARSAEDTGGVLPKTEGLARTYIIEPLAELIAVDRFTVYAGGLPKPLVVDAAGKWQGMEDVPIVPQLTPIWTLPAALREVVER